MKQSDKVSCVAVVLAMIVGETEQYVRDWLGFSPPYTDLDAALFLVHHGVILGTFIVFEDTKNHGMRPDRDYEVAFPIKDRPAYVLVKSERFPDLLHALFWDGEVVHDPNPESADGRPLSEYEIHHWYPLTYTEERYKWWLAYKTNKT